MIRLVCVVEFPDVATVEDAQARLALLDGGSQWLGKLTIAHASEREADTACYRQDEDEEPDRPPVVLALQEAAALALEHAAAEAAALADLQHCPHCREALTAGDRTIGTCGHCRGQLPPEPWQTERQP